MDIIAEYWEIITNYVNPVIAALLWCVGLFLKKLPKFKSDWAIPIVILALSIPASIYWLYSMHYSEYDSIHQLITSGIIQGVFAAALAVFGNEIKKQVTNGRKEDNEK